MNCGSSRKLLYSTISTPEETFEPIEKKRALNMESMNKYQKLHGKVQRRLKKDKKQTWKLYVKNWKKTRQQECEKRVNERRFYKHKAVFQTGNDKRIK